MYNYKKIILGLFAAAIFMLSSCKMFKDDKESGQDSLKDRIIKNEEIVVGFEPDSPPVYYSDGSKKVGFDYELLQYIVKNKLEGVKIRVVEESYEKLSELLKSGKIDIMAGGRTEEENDGVLYSRSYLTFGYAIVVNKEDGKKYNNIKKLEGKSIGVYDEFAEEWVRTNISGAKVSVIGGEEDESTVESDWMKKLVEGELDAIIYDYPFATNEIDAYGNKLTISASNINGKNLNKYVLGINPENPGSKSFMSMINAAIKEYKETEEYAEAIAKYIPNAGLQDAEVGDVASKSGPSSGHIIKRGETLSKIAREHLGDSDRWEEIFNLNMDILASPEIIYAGQYLKVPSDWKY